MASVLDRPVSSVRRAAEAVIYVKRSRRVVDWVRRLPPWITPNRVTAFRMALTPLIAWAGLGGEYAAMAALAALAAPLDALDGMIAEARGPKTESGAFLDPLADKLLVWAIVYPLLPALPPAFAVLFWTIFAFGIGNTLGRVAKAILSRRYDQTSLMAVPVSKYKFILEIVGCFLLLISLAWPPLVWAAGAALALSVPCAFFSLLAQVPRLRRR